MESIISKVLLVKTLMAGVIILATILLHVLVIYPNYLIVINTSSIATKWNFGCGATVITIMSLICLYLIVTGDFSDFEE